MRMTTKYHSAEWAPHEGSINTLRKVTEKIEADGGDLFAILPGAPGSAILVAKYPVAETATQEQADDMIASGEAEIPEEAVVSEAEADGGEKKKSGRRRNR